MLTGIIEDSRDNIELSLLVIDMGDSCCVRVERGMLNTLMHNGEVMLVGALTGTALVQYPFTDIRAAIDASYVIESSPLPRIERVPDTLNEGYRVFKPTITY